MSQKEEHSTSPTQLLNPLCKAEDVEDDKKSDRKADKDSFFSLTDHVIYQPMPTVQHDRQRSLPSSMARIVSLVGLSSALLLPLSACMGGNNAPPCAAPTREVSEDDPPIKCTTSNGSHYVWYPNRGGWVPSDDGVHPRPGASGVGAEDSNSHSGRNGRSGVGGSESGSHGGGEGG